MCADAEQAQRVSVETEWIDFRQQWSRCIIIACGKNLRVIT